MKIKIIIAIVVFLIGAQFVRIDKSVASVDPQGTFDYMYAEDNLDIKQIKASCYDCHSNKTKYPTYAEIAPLSWWLKGHINAGREKLNFSIWNSYSTSRQISKLEESIEVIGNKRMPLKSYGWMHNEAQLSEDARDKMIGDLQKVILKISDSSTPR